LEQPQHIRSGNDDRDERDERDDAVTGAIKAREDQQFSRKAR